MSLRLKVEPNCCEHAIVLGMIKFPFLVECKWYNVSCKITTYQLKELLSAKLRVLHQWRKERDLFDLYTAITPKHLSYDQILTFNSENMNFLSSNAPTQKVFLQTMEIKCRILNFLVIHNYYYANGKLTSHKRYMNR